jgi:hypothetical protein
MEPFTEKEIKRGDFSKWNIIRTLVQMDSQLSSIGFFWDIIKSDLMELFNDDFQNGTLPLHRRNFGS